MHILIQFLYSQQSEHFHFILGLFYQTIFNYNWNNGNYIYLTVAAETINLFDIEQLFDKALTAIFLLLLFLVFISLFFSQFSFASLRIS